MRLTQFAGRSPRPGTVLPMLGVCLIGLFGFVALAVDLGMLAVSRTQCQNGADVAALVGTRTLNNKDGVAYSNLPAAMTALKSAATVNPHLSANLTNAQISKIEAGQYLYDPTSQTFRVTTWTDVTSNGSVSPATGSWTALRITVSVAQPTYFLRVFGVTTMPSGARATAVYRPRDIAFVLDMTGSMKYSSTYNSSNTTSTRNYQSMNPDTLVPGFGHYYTTTTRGAIVATSNLTNGSGEAIQRNNYTIATPAGPPIMRNFYFDPTNVSTPATVAFPLTTKADGSANLLNAFHRWNPPESGGNSLTYTGPTYNFTGYDATHNGTEGSPKGPTPAPDTFGAMIDSGGITYVGDRYRRRDGAIDKTTADWSTGNYRAAYHAADLLGYTGATPPIGITPAFVTTWLDFRDPVWEKWGYDLDVVKYRSQRGTGAPMDPSVFKANNGNSDANILLPTADRFVGYSMGPGYWGKTFYIWPPDPRFDTSANVLSPDPAKPGFDTSGKEMCDWRRRFFFDRQGGNLDPQTDNDTSDGDTDNINKVILNTGGSGHMMAMTAGTQVNYAAILKWLKTGPQVLPPNLRAGRVLYYSSIPDDVNTATGTTQQQLDKGFWKNYIDFVLGIGSYTGSANLYGVADSWSDSSASVTTSDMMNYTFGWDGTNAKRPYMRYTDSPRRPRLHMWFGPLSMVHFLTAVNGTGDNWLAGTTYEAHSWQLKAGMNSVISDVKNNHPNDYAGLVYFSSVHNGVRIGLSQDYTRLKNALFYPRLDNTGADLLTKIGTGDVTTELRPYTNTSLGGYTDTNIPNAGGATDPNTGLMYAFNVLSPSSLSAATALGTGAGRRGAQKIIIFETDGVPNSYRSVTFNQRGYNSYYAPGGFTSAGNGDATSMSTAYTVIQQIVKQMANTTTSGVDSGLSLPNAPARVYPIAFGDLFDVDLAPGATFRTTAHQFLANCAYYGGTGPSGAATLPDSQVITGPYSQRITRLRDCLERIFQSGASVVLVE